MEYADVFVMARRGHVVFQHHLASHQLIVRRTWLVTFFLVVFLASGCGRGGGGSDSGISGEQNTEPSVSAGVMVLWDVPINPDGSAVSNLSHYRAYYSTTSPITLNNSQILSVDGASTSVALTDFPTGTYYVAVTAVYTGGDESDPSEEIEIAIQ